MKTIKLKHGIVLASAKDRAVKLEWGRLGWFGFAFRRDLRGFTLNFFLYWNLHISFAYTPIDSIDQKREVKTYGGMIIPASQTAIWQWAWTGGGSEVNKPGIFREFAYGDIILGAPVFAERSIGTFRRELEMPEATYMIDVTVDEGSWKRPRSPFTRRLFRAKIEVADQGEIPVPTSETEESATYGETRNGLKSGSVSKILKDYKHDLMEERKFVGGSYDWRPGDDKASTSQS